jgi:hypothetical protein
MSSRMTNVRLLFIAVISTVVGIMLLYAVLYIQELGTVDRIKKMNLDCELNNIVSIINTSETNNNIDDYLRRKLYKQYNKYNGIKVYNKKGDKYNSEVTLIIITK